ncbi:alpha-amylase family glycosyl hydrolase [Deinococcus deserti]|uniref:Putative alpha amylase, catalytic region n=1 Tax=Deinococcus deserti (strain DSM 17065 / CIP 109153 / LMG 22923 / VCD115) TaxID=546414 RepID=C1D0Q0_DEIDV|nr:alpha-amylase family glycosyl hydrolase [Deinococcus deserti]ACO45424.2 putative alpha amylase, catalytic region [Deinococcus deserti VCD115]
MTPQDHTHDAHPLTPDWVKDAVFYQIFPDRFARSGRVTGLNLQPWGDTPHFNKYMGGDLWGVLERLDYIQSLGVNAIYFCPVFQSASNHRYHTHDYYQVDPMLGGNEALRALIDAAHARGIRVVLDGVFNHASRGFFQFNDLLEQGEDSAYRDWFHVEGWPLRPYDDSRPANYAAWWGNRALPKFNTSNAAVRDFLWDVAEHWIRFGIDGWRLDVPNEIDDDSFWQEFRRRVKALNPEAYIVGEIWGDAHRWLAGDQFDGVMNYHFTRPCLAFFGAETLDHAMNERSGTGLVAAMTAEAFGARMTEVTRMYHPEVVQAQLNLLDSHDTARYLSAVGGDASAHRLALTFLMTYVGAPCLYYGDEIGLPGGPDPDCRRAFPWNEGTWDHVTLNLTRKLTAARHASPALQRGGFRVTHACGQHLVFAREHSAGNAYVAMNCAPTPASLPVDAQPGKYCNVLSGQIITIAAQGEVDVPGRGAVVLLPV